MRYLILTRPNYNVAFHEVYITMCQVELKMLLEAHNYSDISSKIQKINKATYIDFEINKELSDPILKSIYQLSFFYSLFEAREGGMLKPVLIAYQPDFNEDLSIRLKYRGKTNEVITRMMMNMAYYASDFVGAKKINLLDPLCGKGTTLFEAMISGYNAYGVERDKKHVNDLGTYITRYVKEARFKHVNKRGKVIVDRKIIGETYELEYAKDKAKYRAKDMNELKVLRGDTTNIKGAFRGNSMHLIVTDLPYGVQHSGKVDKEKVIGLSGLLESGIIAWSPFLKKGGVIALSWNIFTDTRKSFIEIFEKHGYEVLNDTDMKSLQHRVSQAITRDIIIAKKK